MGGNGAKERQWGVMGVNRQIIYVRNSLDPYSTMSVAWDMFSCVGECVTDNC